MGEGKWEERRTGGSTEEWRGGGIRRWAEGGLKNRGNKKLGRDGGGGWGVGMRNGDLKVEPIRFRGCDKQGGEKVKKEAERLRWGGEAEKRNGKKNKRIVQQQIKAGAVNGVMEELDRPVYAYEEVLYPPGERSGR